MYRKKCSNVFHIFNRNCQFVKMCRQRRRPSVVKHIFLYLIFSWFSKFMWREPCQLIFFQFPWLLHMMWNTWMNNVYSGVSYFVNWLHGPNSTFKWISRFLICEVSIDRQFINQIRFTSILWSGMNDVYLFFSLKIYCFLYLFFVA